MFNKILIGLNLIPSTVIMLIGSFCLLIGKVQGFWLAVIFAGLAVGITLWVSVAAFVVRWIMKTLQTRRNKNRNNSTHI